jgi:hypothetical protein
MRSLFLLCLALAACAADPVLLPDAGPCSSACGAGTVCSGGACVAVDAGGGDVPAADVGEDRPAPPDAGPVDVGVDVVAVADAPAGDAVDAADAGADVVALADVSCNADAGLYACGGTCRDLVRDSMNCGRCGDVCTGAATCMAAQCVDPQTDPMNCGGLGRRCNIPNGTAACVAGACAIGSCRAPFANCDARTDTGCEANTLTNAAHCGACGVSCPDGGTCVAGHCS